MTEQPGSNTEFSKKVENGVNTLIDNWDGMNKDTQKKVLEELQSNISAVLNVSPDRLSKLYNIIPDTPEYRTLLSNISSIISSKKLADNARTSRQSHTAQNDPQTLGQTRRGKNGGQNDYGTIDPNYGNN